MSNQKLYWPWTIFPLLDPRLKDYPLVGNFWLMTGLVLAYVYFVKIFGPRWMANKQAFEITCIIKVYNFLNIFVNLYFTIQFSRYSYLGGGYSWFCQKMDHAQDENSIMLVKLGYFYCIVRVIDFLDTIFFILRKKFSQLHPFTKKRLPVFVAGTGFSANLLGSCAHVQNTRELNFCGPTILNVQRFAQTKCENMALITTLHYTHHALVAWSGWLFVSVGCDGQVVLGIIVNSAVHVLMYTYYFLAACGPTMRPYLWWKRYITRIQIGQFVCLLLHITIPLFHDCGYPRGLLAWAFAQGAFGLILFINFYIQSYIRKNSAVSQKASIDESLIRSQEAKRA